MPSPPSRLEEALLSPEDFGGLLSPGDYGGLAERLEEALLQGRRDVTAFTGQLEALLNAQVSRLPHRARAELAGDEPTDVRLGYEIGMLNFAQLLTAQGAAHRAPDRVEDLARSAPMAPYIHALAEGEWTNSELSERLGEAMETVSRKLRKLRTAGLADFRRDGRNSANFLTPIGRVLAGVNDSTPVPANTAADESALMHRVLLQTLQQKVPNYLRSQPVLGVDTVHAPTRSRAHAG